MGGKEIAQLGLVLYEDDIHTKYGLYSLVLLQFHSKYVFFCHRYTRTTLRSYLSGGASARKGSNSKGRDVEIWGVDSYTDTEALRAALTTAILLVDAISMRIVNIQTVLLLAHSITQNERMNSTVPQYQANLEGSS